ncbi:hypothetical protein [Actinoplanes sp. NPDC051494]|uniref:hypothetical protein n=1 Tax=Actinoplanes sp. NPDC051494 TaxID=3363907 RepID=UPI003791F7C0
MHLRSSAFPEPPDGRPGMPTTPRPSTPRPSTPRPSAPGPAALSQPGPSQPDPTQAGSAQPGPAAQPQPGPPQPAGPATPSRPGTFQPGPAAPSQGGPGPAAFTPPGMPSYFQPWPGQAGPVAPNTPPAPVGPTASAGAASPIGPTAPAVQAPRRSRKRLVIGSALAGVLVAGAAVAVVLTTSASGSEPGFTRYVATGEPFTMPTRVSGGTPAPHVPTQRLVETALAGQAKALLDGDLKGWLASVDPGKPKVVAYYKDLFTALRALGVTSFEYEDTSSNFTSENDVRWESDYRINYCFSVPECAGSQQVGPLGTPRINQKLTLRKDKDNWLISGVGSAKRSDTWEPTPWQRGGMVFAQGERVTVGASRGNAKRLAEVAAAADKAAAVTDRYAQVIGSSPDKYRIYLATDKEWGTWFKEDDDLDGYQGYAKDINHIQYEVVLKSSGLDSGAGLREIIQHELGHVVAGDGTGIGKLPVEMDVEWLSEGFAEYVSYDGRPAVRSDRAPAVRALVNSKRPYDSIDVLRPDITSKLPTVDQFYGWGAFAVDCMAQKYGRDRMLGFVTDVYRVRGTSFDEAAQKNLGVSFDELDRGCVTWIRKQF